MTYERAGRVDSINIRRGVNESWRPPAGTMVTVSTRIPAALWLCAFPIAAPPFFFSTAAQRFVLPRIRACGGTQFRRLAFAGAAPSVHVFCCIARLFFLYDLRRDIVQSGKLSIYRDNDGTTTHLASMSS